MANLGWDHSLVRKSSVTTNVSTVRNGFKEALNELLAESDVNEADVAAEVCDP